MVQKSLNGICDNLRLILMKSLSGLILTIKQKYQG